MTTATTGTTITRPAFGAFWAAQTAGACGDRLTAFTVPSAAILVFGATGTQTGLLAAAGWLAYPVFGLVAGTLLTRLPLRPVLVAAETVRFAAFASIPFAGGITQLVIATAVAGIATVFIDIGTQAQLPRLVPHSFLLTANARLQATDSLSRLLGPALAGATIAATGPLAAIVANAFPFLLAAHQRTRVPETPVPPQARSPIWRHPILRDLTTAAVLRGFGVGAIDAVLLLLLYRSLDASSTTGGLVLAIGAAGGLLGAVLVTRLNRDRATILSGMEGAAWLALPLGFLAPPLLVVIAIRAISSFWMSAAAVIGTGIRQEVTADPGAHASFRTVSSTAIALGALTGGAATHLLDPVAVLVTAGAVAAASAPLLVRAARRHAREDRR